MHWFGLSLAALSIIWILGVLILAFEVWMFVDVIRNDQIAQERKLLWLIGMVLIHPFVAIAYYFTDRQT